MLTNSITTDITNNRFVLALAGSLTGYGPLDAYIQFPDAIIVNYDGADIAAIWLPPICPAANTGAPDLTSAATLTITN